MCHSLIYKTCECTGIGNESYYQKLSFITHSIYLFSVLNLTFIELEADRRSRASAGVMDWLFPEVIPGKDVTPKLHQQLDHFQIVCFSSVVEGRLMNLCSIYIRTLDELKKKKSLYTPLKQVNHTQLVYQDSIFAPLDK